MESIGNILKIILILLEVVVIFNLMIVVHELGHFLAARWRGLVIDRFGIWFGKPIWKKKINGVDYCLGWIPAGGYVALPQMAAMETIEGKNAADAKQLPPVKPIDKIIVAFAGPLFSLMLAFVFAIVIMVIGKPVSEGDANTVIGFVLPDGPAAKAIGSDGSIGLKPGDKVLEVDNQRVSRFNGMNESIRWRIVRSEGDQIPFLIERDGKQLTFVSDFRKEKRSMWMRPSMREVGIEAAQRPMVDSFVPHSVAAQSGLRPGDIVTAINGEPVYTWIGLEDALSKLTAPAVLSVLRGEERIDVTLPPAHAVINSVLDVPNSPAVAAGLKAEDIIVSANGTQVLGSQQLMDLVRTGNGAPVKLGILRDGKPMDLTVAPAMAKTGENVEPGYKMGVGLSAGIIWSPLGKTTLIHPNPVEEVVGGVTTMVNTISALLSPKSDVKIQHLGGPVQIGNVYYRLLEAPDGWRRALWFSILLNVNLAIMNMLPLPVLDGGHITLSLLEMIRRRPLNARILEALQTSCALLLIGFMLFVTFFDVGELGFFPSKKPQTLEFVRPASSAK